MRGLNAAAAVVACALLAAAAPAAAKAEARVFSYHHAEGQRSQQGHHSAHSVSQIALPDMRFASQHASVMSSTSAGAEQHLATAASMASGQHLAAAASALAHASAAAADASAVSAASQAERLQGKLARIEAQAQATAATAAHEAAQAAATATAQASAASAAAATAEAEAEVVPGVGAAETFPRAYRVEGYPGDSAVLTAKLSSPITGTYGRSYGPVSQLLGQGSGYGGFTGNVDPLGFNFQHDDVTPTGGPKGWGAATLSGLPFGAMYPARMKVRQATSVNGLSPLGITASLSDASYTLMGPKSLGPYGVDGVGDMSPGPAANLVGYGLALPTVVSAYPGYSPLSGVVTTVGSGGGGGGAAGSGQRTRGGSRVVVINAPSSGGGGAQLAGLGAALDSSGGDVNGSPSVAFLSGLPLSNGSPVNGLRLTYNPMLVTQRALYMGGGINQYNTPGVITPLGVSYPSPAFDRYASVAPVSRLGVQVHTSPLSNLLLTANIGDEMNRNRNMPRDPVTGLPLALAAALGKLNGVKGFNGGMMNPQPLPGQLPI